MKAKVVVGMSGGVDSSVAAYLLKKQGYQVIGVSLKLYPEVSKCCRLEDIEDARRVAESIGIPHFVFDYTKEFKKAVVDYFAREYMKGRTPNPCALCNREIKFGLFLKKAKELGATYLATGHYARIVYKNSEPFLTPARDTKKSQEYFLSLIEPTNLKSVIFPLGNFKKEEVREIAKQAKLPLRQKKESQDVCFVGEDGYLEFLRKKYSLKVERGIIVNSEGNHLGYHKGFIRYTIGQRKGIGIPSSSPLYVIKIEPEKNLIVVGERNSAFFRNIKVNPVIWRGKSSGEYLVKIRYNHKPAPARVFFNPGEEEIEVEFHHPQFAPTPGQVAAFYNKELLVIGAGFIDSLNQK